MSDHEPWDLMLATCGIDRMGKLLRSMVKNEVYFTCSMTWAKNLFPWHSIEFRVWAKPEHKDAFEKEIGVELTPPPRIRAGA